MRCHIFVGISFPSSDGTYVFVHPNRCHGRVVVQLQLCVVGRFLLCLGNVGSPFHTERVIVEQMVFTHERCVGNVLSLPTQSDGLFSFCVGITHLGIVKLHIACIECQLVVVVEQVVGFDVCAQPALVF